MGIILEIIIFSWLAVLTIGGLYITGKLIAIGVERAINKLKQLRQLKKGNN